jgi:hypothetical protein
LAALQAGLVHFSSGFLGRFARQCAALRMTGPLNRKLLAGKSDLEAD